MIKLKKLLLFIFGVFLSTAASAQYYDSTELLNIHMNRTASEGDLYQDTIKGNYYIGLTSGALTQINFNPDSVSGSIFPIWAEESGALDTNQFEWAYGNGDNSQAGFGIVVPMDCELFAVGLSLNEGNAEVEVYIDGIASGYTSDIAGAGPSNVALNLLDVPEQIAAGTVINFRTLIPVGAISGGKAVAWFRTVSKIPSYKRYNESGIPSAGLGRDGDEYLDIVSGNLYVRETGSWNYKINLQGSAGSVTSKALIQMTNIVSGNINNGMIPFSWFDTTSSNIIQDASTTFTKDTFGVTVNQTGLYKVTVYQYQNSTVQRANAAVRITINGSVQPGYGANAYIRTQTGHEESTASIVKIIAASAGDEIGVLNEQLAAGGNVTSPAGSLIFIVEEL